VIRPITPQNPRSRRLSIPTLCPLYFYIAKGNTSRAHPSLNKPYRIIHVMSTPRLMPFLLSMLPPCKFVSLVTVHKHDNASIPQPSTPPAFRVPPASGPLARLGLFPLLIPLQEHRQLAHRPSEKHPRCRVRRRWCEPWPQRAWWWS